MGTMWEHESMLIRYSCLIILSGSAQSHQGRWSTWICQKGEQLGTRYPVLTVSIEVTSRNDGLVNSGSSKYLPILWARHRSGLWPIRSARFSSVLPWTLNHHNSLTLSHTVVQQWWRKSVFKRTWRKTNSVRSSQSGILPSVLNHWLIHNIYQWKGVIEGVVYLHSHDPPIVHGDLKPVSYLLPQRKELTN